MNSATTATTARTPPYDPERSARAILADLRTQLSEYRAELAALPDPDWEPVPAKRRQITERGFHLRNAINTSARQIHRLEGAAASLAPLTQLYGALAAAIAKVESDAAAIEATIAERRRQGARDQDVRLAQNEAQILRQVAREGRSGWSGGALSSILGREYPVPPQLARHLPPGIDPAALRPLEVLAGEIAATTDRLLDLLGSYGDETARSIRFDRQRATGQVLPDLG